MNVVVKELPPEKWEEYKRIRLEALKNEPLAFGSSYEEEKDREPKVWKERMERDTSPLFALVNGQVVGVAVYAFEKGIKLDHIAHIYSVYVKKEFRGKGIASKLLNSVLRKIFANKKIKKIVLNVTEIQKPARELYKQLGFREVGVLKKEICVDKKYYNSVVMEKMV